MGKIFKLIRSDNSETVKKLAELLERAKRGEIVGIAACYHTLGGGEKAAFTGMYRANPYKAAAAAMRLSVAVASANGEYDHYP